MYKHLLVSLYQEEVKIPEKQCCAINKIFRDSSAVEQLPVKQLVVGSIPTRGAPKSKSQPHLMLAFTFWGSAKQANCFACV